MPRTGKLGLEEKVAIVRRCLSGESSIREASHEAGVDWKTVQQWMIRYEAEGAAGFLPYKRNRKYDKGKKLQFQGRYGNLDLPVNFGLAGTFQVGISCAIPPRL